MEKITDFNLKALILKKAKRQTSDKCCIFDVVVGISEKNVVKRITDNDFPPYKTICTFQSSCEDIDSNVYYHAFINNEGNAYLNKNYDNMNTNGRYTKWLVNTINEAKLSYDDIDLNFSPIYNDQTTKNDLILNQDLEYFFIKTIKNNLDVIIGPFLNREVDFDKLIKSLHNNVVNNLEVTNQFKDIRYVLVLEEELNNDNFILNYTNDNLNSKNNKLHITTDAMKFLKSFAYLVPQSQNQRHKYLQCITLFFQNQKQNEKSFKFIMGCIEEHIIPVLDDEGYDKNLNKEIRKLLNIFMTHKSIKIKEEFTTDIDNNHNQINDDIENNENFNSDNTLENSNNDEQDRSINDYVNNVNELDTELMQLKEKLKVIEIERDEYKKESEESQSIISNSETQITDLHVHNKNLTEEIEQLRNNHEKLQKEKIKLEEVSGLHVDNEKLKLDNDDLTEQNGKLKKVRRNIEEEIEANKQEKQQLEDEILRISQSDYTPAINDLLKEAVKQSPLIKLITGIDNLESDRTDNIEYKVFNINESIDNTSCTPEDNINNIFNYVYGQLNKIKYRISPKLLSAILISLAQNTLVMLAGDPGNGKTSLSTHISEILKLTENNFAHIAVARDWTTSDDLIGFYNNINNKFQPANNDIYKLMQQTDKATNKDIDNSRSKMNLVLLDEANLSPLEYYLSDFISQWDKEYITINISHNQSLKLDHKFKMIATLNTDYTTESISPRMRDRANIIWLNNSNAEIQKIHKIEDLEFSADDFFNAYTANISDKDWISAFFVTIKSLPLIQLSERKKKSLKNFCNIAEKIKYNNENVFTIDEVKDYAFAISCVPTISTDKKDDINTLISKLREFRWSYSHELVENIHEKNKNSGYYDLLA